VSQPPDPFTGLDEWARTAERRQTRAHTVRRLTRIGRWTRLRRRARGRRRPGRGFLIVTGVVAVVVATSWAARGNWMQWGPSAYPTQSHPAGVHATTTASAKPKGPFEGTPAETYPEGEKGIAMPATTGVPGFTDEQAAAMLESVRAALAAGRLDPRMVTGRDPAAFLALLAPRMREQIGPWFADGNALSLATRVADGYQLSALTPRVSGRVTIQPGTTDSGVKYLDVVTNFVWVYAWAGDDNRVFLVHDEVRWRTHVPDRLAAKDRGMGVVSARSYLFGDIDCKRADGLVAPPPTREVLPHSTRSGDERQYYDPNRALEIDGDCD
jgi:hypothetical protein